MSEVRGDDITIVPMTPAHVDALMPHERDMFGTEAWSERSYREEIADARNRYYVAVEGPDGVLLGWAGVLVIAGTADVLTVGVVPSARRRGLARRMLAALCTEAARRGATEIFLDVRVDNESAGCGRVMPSGRERRQRLHSVAGEPSSTAVLCESNAGG